MWRNCTSYTKIPRLILESHPFLTDAAQGQENCIADRLVKKAGSLRYTGFCPSNNLHLLVMTDRIEEHSQQKFIARWDQTKDCTLSRELLRYPEVISAKEKKQCNVPATALAPFYDEISWQGWSKEMIHRACTLRLFCFLPNQQIHVRQVLAYPCRCQGSSRLHRRHYLL